MTLAAAVMVLAAGGAGLLAVALLAARGRLRRNMLVGLRTRATLRDEAAWQAAHRKIGPSLAAAGLVWIGSAAALAAVRPEAAAARSAFAAALGLLLTWLLLAAWRGQRAAKAASRDY